MRLRAVATAVLLGALTNGLVGCAARPLNPSAPYDPLEGVNRKIFWFNDKLDGYVLEPTAKVWNWFLPTPVQESIDNFFVNVRFPVNAVNNLLQGKVKQSAVTVARFGINTTVGVVGFFDPAAHWGLERRDEDFGQTLAIWGLGPGPYLVLPILGPSSPRDAVGIGADTVFSVVPFFAPWYWTLAPRVVDTVNARALVLKEVDAAKEAAIDLYVFVRDAYFQRRGAQVRDQIQIGPSEDIYQLEFPQ